MKLLQFRYISLFAILGISTISYIVYSAIIFDTDDSSIWYGPYNPGYTDSGATVSKDNNLDGGPFSCPSSSCGDGIVNGSDICDKSDPSHTNWGINGCNNSCIPIAAAVCGDTIVTPPEICDEGILNGNPGHCSITCDKILPLCGNNIVESGELCDKGTGGGMIDATQLCSRSCKIKISGGGPNWCGDDEIDLGEACDEGSTNGTGPGHCRPDCSGIEPIPCTGCSCDSSCPVYPIISVVTTPLPTSTKGTSSNTFPN